MEVIALQSGSNGNCIYVEAGGKQLLFDAGISGARAEKRLAQHGRDIRDVDALIISHDHSDHTRCMGVYHRKFGLPIHVTDETMSALERKNRIGRVDDVQRFKSGSTLDFGHVRVETIKTPHDAVDGLAFIVDDGSNRLGILTDLGHVFSGLDYLLSTLDAVIIESNYDTEMLASGPYPEALKRRISGPGGHLSNAESADLLLRSASRTMQWVCMGHLSQHNNEPDLVIETHRAALGTQFPLFVADRYAGQTLPLLKPR